MRPNRFATLLHQWVAAADHPAVQQVRAATETGHVDHRFGVTLTLNGGWTAIVQVVATSPPQGDTAEADVLPGDDVYRQAAERFATEQGRVAKAKGGTPPLTEAAVLELLLDAIKTAEYDDVAEVRASNPGTYRSLTVRCSDGYRLYLFVAGYLPPGHTVFPHPLRDMPEGWR